jgi:hypothetical protein
LLLLFLLPQHNNYLFLLFLYWFHGRQYIRVVELWQSGAGDALSGFMENDEAFREYPCVDDLLHFGVVPTLPLADFAGASEVLCVVDDEFEVDGADFPLEQFEEGAFLELGAVELAGEVVECVTDQCGRDQLDDLGGGEGLSSLAVFDEEGLDVER